MSIKDRLPDIIRLVGYLLRDHFAHRTVGA